MNLKRKRKRHILKRIEHSVHKAPIGFLNLSPLLGICRFSVLKPSWQLVVAMWYISQEGMISRRNLSFLWASQTQRKWQWVSLWLNYSDWYVLLYTLIVIHRQQRFSWSWTITWIILWLRNKFLFFLRNLIIVRSLNSIIIGSLWWI